jgi:hypothetical protein
MKEMHKEYIGYTDYQFNKGVQIYYSEVEVSLLKYKNEKLNDGEIKGVIIHELGHALGLGHSDIELDLMYPYIPPELKPEMDFNELTTGDILAVRSVINLGEDK